MSMQWDKYRIHGGEISLTHAYADRYGHDAMGANEQMALIEIMSLQPIVSRQAAAIAIATIYNSRRRDGS